MLLNKDQQKTVVKPFFRGILKYILKLNFFLNFLLMNLLGMNRTQQTLLFSNEATLILIETFLKKGSFITAGSINTGGSIYTGAAHFPHPSSISTFRQLKRVILFLFDF